MKEVENRVDLNRNHSSGVGFLSSLLPTDQLENPYNGSTGSMNKNQEKELSLIQSPIGTVSSKPSRVDKLVGIDITLQEVPDLSKKIPFSENSDRIDYSKPFEKAFIKQSRYSKSKKVERVDLIKKSSNNIQTNIHDDSSVANTIHDIMKVNESVDDVIQGENRKNIDSSKKSKNLSLALEHLYNKQDESDEIIVWHLFTSKANPSTNKNKYEDILDNTQEIKTTKGESQTFNIIKNGQRNTTYEKKDTMDMISSFNNRSTEIAVKKHIDRSNHELVHRGLPSKHNRNTLNMEDNTEKTKKLLFPVESEYMYRNDDDIPLNSSHAIQRKYSELENYLSQTTNNWGGNEPLTPRHQDLWSLQDSRKPCDSTGDIIYSKDDSSDMMNNSNLLKGQRENNMVLNNSHGEKTDHSWTHFPKNLTPTPNKTLKSSGCSSHDIYIEALLRKHSTDTITKYKRNEISLTKLNIQCRSKSEISTDRESLIHSLSVVSNDINTQYHTRDSVETVVCQKNNALRLDSLKELHKKKSHVERDNEKDTSFLSLKGITTETSRSDDRSPPRHDLEEGNFNQHSNHLSNWETSFLYAARSSVLPKRHSCKLYSKRKGRSDKVDLRKTTGSHRLEQTLVPPDDNHRTDQRSKKKGTQRAKKSSYASKGSRYSEGRRSLSETPSILRDLVGLEKLPVLQARESHKSRDSRGIQTSNNTKLLSRGFSTLNSPRRGTILSYLQNGENSDDEFSHDERILLSFSSAIEMRNTVPPLHHAAGSGDEIEVLRIIEQNCDIRAREEAHGQTAMHVAVRQGHITIVNILCRHRDGSLLLNMADYQGNTALHFACSVSGTLVQLLLHYKAQPNATNCRGQTPLSIFVLTTKRDSKIIPTMLLNEGASANANMGDGQNVLTRAVKRKFFRLMGILIEYGATLDGEDAEGRTIFDLIEGSVTRFVIEKISYPPGWQEGKKRTECMECARLFTFFLRKHHCRHCGRICCHNCSNFSMAAEKFPEGFSERKHKISGQVRVCKICYYTLQRRRVNESRENNTGVRNLLPRLFFK